MSILADKRVAPWLSGELRTADEVRDAVYLFTGDAPAKLSRFWLLLVLSAVIASAGVIGDSTATVIGAMIIAPLATPIQGIAVGLAGGELRELLQSTRILLVAGAGRGADRRGRRVRAPADRRARRPTRRSPGASRPR